MSGFEVEQSALPATRAVAIQVGDELQAGIGDLTATMTSLLGGGWSGQAANAFRAGFDEWRDGAGRVLASLRSAADALGATSTDYREQDAISQDAISADVVTRLGGGL